MLFLPYLQMQLFRKLSMKTVNSAGIVTYLKENNQLLYLLLHYPSGHWDFPKGKLEPGETKEQAAMRELKEETGLTATINPGFLEPINYFFPDQEGGTVAKTVFFFVGQTTSKDVTVSHEHQGYIWLSYHDALMKLSYQNAKEILKKAHLFLHTKAS